LSGTNLDGRRLALAKRGFGPWMGRTILVSQPRYLPPVPLPLAKSAALEVRSAIPAFAVDLSSGTTRATAGQPPSETEPMFRPCIVVRSSPSIDLPAI